MNRLEVPLQDMGMVNQATLDALVAARALIAILTVVYTTHGKKVMTTEGIAAVDKQMAIYDYEEQKFNLLTKRYRVKS